MTTTEAIHGDTIDQWQRIRREFSRAIEKGKNSGIEQAADRLVAYACEENTDCLSVLEALEIGYKAMATPGQHARFAGVRVLEGVEAYLDDLGVCHKLLVPSLDRLPDIQRAADAITRASDVIGRTGKFRHTAPPDIPAIYEFVHSLSSFAREDLSAHIPVVPIFPRTAAENQENFDAAYQPYVDILNAFGAMADEQYDVAHLRFGVLQALFRQGRSELVPHIASRTFGNGMVSLQDILGDDGSDTERLGQNILSYLSSLPKGDLLWGRIADLFTLPATIESGDERYGPSQQDFAWNIFLFQKWFGETLVIPTLAGQGRQDAQPDRQTDRLIAQAITKLSGAALYTFGLMLYQVTTHPIAFMRTFHPTMSDQEAGSYAPLVLLAQSQHVDQDGSGLMIADRAIHYLLQAQWGAISESVKLRIGRLPQARRGVERLLDGMASYVLRDYDTELTQDLLLHLRANLGENFASKLDELVPQIRQVSARILGELSEPLDYWPHDGIMHTMRFAAGSLPDILGLSSISMVFGPTATERIGFRFILAGKAMGLSGKIDPLNHDISWHINEQIFDADLLTVIALIVLASLRDYVKKGDVVVVDAHRPPPQEPESADRHGRTRERRSIPHRPAPRRTVVYLHGHESGTETVIAAADVAAAIETRQAELGLTVRHVDSFRRTLVDDQAEREFADAIRLEAWDNARGIREGFRQPSREKLHAIAGLPPRLQLRPLLDPDTGETLTDILPRREGIPLYRDTWVRQHTRPRLTAEEIFSLDTLYERRYRQAEGSALKFLDELTPMLLGLEEQEENL